MKCSSLMPILALFALPFTASAHEAQIFEVNGLRYEFVVGSLNEPIVVDDKTGVELRVTEIGQVGQPEREIGRGPEAGSPVIGLENLLKVELIAGDKRKTVDFTPVGNTPGLYRAPFYPTVATTYTYRIHGEVNRTPFDVSFTCNPAGHASAAEDTNTVQASPGVTRISKSGSFGCPSPKAEMGFPEDSIDIRTLNDNPTETIAWGAGALAIAALAAALLRRRF